MKGKECATTVLSKYKLHYLTSLEVVTHIMDG